MGALRLGIALIALAMLTSTSAFGNDLEKVKRTIGKQPIYDGKPLYALGIFGAKAETRMWMVLDQSNGAQGKYDVLFIDLNGDGDLTDDKERWVTKNGSNRFTRPTLIDPNTGEKHREFSLRIMEGSRPQHMFSLKWQGKHKIGGGYPVDPGKGYMRFAESVEEAPIIWFNGDGPFRFQAWYETSLAIGGDSDLKLFLGLEGVGHSAFCAFQEHVLPSNESVIATLVYTDKSGSQKEVTSNLDLRC